MESGIKGGKHLGLSFGVYSAGETCFWNYGAHNSKPISENNYFEMASVGKVLTAILLLKLESQGLLSVDDFIEEYIDEFPIKNKLTIRNLLTHTSGLPESPSNWEFIAPDNSYIGYTGKMLMEDLETVSISEDTFGRFTYSNYNYILLGLIAKRVTNEKNFSKLLTREVLLPLDLKNMTFSLSDRDVKENLITGHSPDLAHVAPYLDLGEVYSGTGALKTTTKELLLFAKMILGKDKSLDDFKAPFKKMLELSKDKDGKAISLGFHVREDEKGTAYYHPGSIAGNKCSFVFSLEKNQAQVYVSTTLSHVRILWDLFYAQ